jgi:hypothetical protein
MRRRYAMALLMILGMAALTYGADDFWVKKDWKTWSKAECKKMLEESPWAKRIVVDNNSIASSLPLATGHLGDNPGFGMTSPGAGDITYFVQLLSAEPVREAFIRQEQIEQKFDKMSGAEKSAFDASVEKQLSFIKGDMIAIRIVFEASKPALGDAVKEYWQNLPPGTDPARTYLVTEKGIKIPPFTFSFMQGSETTIELTFPRSVRTETVIAPDAKSVKLQFPNPAIGEFPERTVTVEYSLDKMAWNGKLAY